MEKDTKWLPKKMLSFRGSASLLAMVRQESQVHRMTISEFIRFALVGTMKKGRYLTAHSDRYDESGGQFKVMK
jgi:hypothetical protein